MATFSPEDRLCLLTNLVPMKTLPAQLSITTAAPIRDVSQETRVAQLTAVQTEARELFAIKNRDYGDAFAGFGVVGVLVRLSDKLKRGMTISATGVTLVNTESLRDTLIDLHNYAAMGVMLIDNPVSVSSPNDAVNVTITK
jgi:hypothetical protein